MSLLCLRSSFSAAHLYHQPAWSEEKNRAVFGRCFTPHGHGHNYVLEVGFITEDANLLTSDQIMQRQELLHALTRKLDHEHLNFSVAEFRDKIPTSENIALYFKDLLQEKIAMQNISYLKLYETDDLWTEIQL